MRLRQKLFTAIIAAMVLMFLLLSLASFLNALEAQKDRRNLEDRIAEAARRSFVDAVRSEGPDRWTRFAADIEPFGIADWEVTESGVAVLGIAPEDSYDAMIEVAREGEFILYRSREVAGLEPVRWLGALFWALGAGTVILLFIVYGLLLRLVLRPVEDLVAASRVLSSGRHPGRVPGENRHDEMGDLIRAFNRMAAEVIIGREDLKRRVDEATREREKALKRLALEQRLSATGQLAGGIAHEINNPLGGMINAARTLAREDGLSQRAGEYVELIEDGLRRIADIVERMRSFNRPRADISSIDVAESVRSALAFCRHRIERDGITVEEHLESGCQVTGDAGELQQVFLNLLLNALDAVSQSEQKQVTIDIADVDGRTTVSVADSGAGMNQEQLASAFDLFYSTKESGTGLGLAIAHKIVTDHGGDIDIESKIGTGTTVRVSLPMAGT